MTRRLSLPLSADLLRKPTVDAVRKRLGGRASTGPGAGDVVALAPAGGAELALEGVVLFTRGEEVDVWIEQRAPGPALAPAAAGLVRRARRDDVRPLGGAASKSLAAVACDARVFGALLEGERIRFQHDGGLGEGTLVEKCRYGALVQRDDGRIVGVGFRRIWPAQRADA